MSEFASNSEMPEYRDLEVSNFHWDRQAACNGEDRMQFYVTSPDKADPADVTEKYCGHCTQAENCLIEKIKAGDAEATIVAGLTANKLRVLIDQYKAFKKERKKQHPDADITLNGILDVIHTQVEVLRTGAYKQILAHEGGVAPSAPKLRRRRETFQKKPAIDVPTIQGFWQRATPEEKLTVEAGISPFGYIARK